MNQDTLDTNPYPTIEDKINLLKSHGVNAEHDYPGDAIILRGNFQTVECAFGIFTEHGVRVFSVHLTVLCDESNKPCDGFYQVITDPGQMATDPGA